MLTLKQLYQINRSWGEGTVLFIHGAIEEGFANMKAVEAVNKYGNRVVLFWNNQVYILHDGIGYNEDFDLVDVFCANSAWNYETRFRIWVGENFFVASMDEVSNSLKFRKVIAFCGNDLELEKED